MSKFKEVLTGLNPLEKIDERGARSTSFSLSGDPHTNAIATAVGAHYHLLSGRERVIEEILDVNADLGAKASILTRQEGMFGSASIQTLAGTLFHGSTGVGILPKGSRKKGYSLAGMLREGRLLDIEEGYKSESVLATRALHVRRQFPELEPLTQAHLNALPDEDCMEESPSASLAVFGSYRFPGETIHGAIWLLHTYMKADDIAEGVLLVPPSQAYSEHGSIYGQELRQMQAGVIKNFNPLPLEDAMDLTQTEYRYALMRVQAPPQVAA